MSDLSKQKQLFTESPAHQCKIVNVHLMIKWFKSVKMNIFSFVIFWNIFYDLNILYNSHKCCISDLHESLELFNCLNVWEFEFLWIFSLVLSGSDCLFIVSYAALNCSCKTNQFSITKSISVSCRLSVLSLCLLSQQFEDIFTKYEDIFYI